MLLQRQSKRLPPIEVNPELHKERGFAFAGTCVVESKFPNSVVRVAAKSLSVSYLAVNYFPVLRTIHYARFSLLPFLWG